MKKITRLIIVTSSFAFFSSIVYGQSDQLIKPRKLNKDFNQFIAFIDAHPDPYTHISESDFTSKIEAVKLAIKEPMSILEFYKHTASIVALIKDGHSSMYLPRNWQEDKRKKYGVFPFHVHLSNDDELYIIKNLGNDEIPNGSKIIKINGITIDSFINRIDPYISYETKNFRNTIIDHSFERYLYVAFGTIENIKLEYMGFELSESHVTLLEYDKWKEKKKGLKTDKQKKIEEGKPYNYENLGNGVGLLSIFSFAPKDVTSYGFFLERTFKDIREDNIHSLIIDLRGNFGGSPQLSSELFHYITPQYFKTMGKSTMKVSLAYRKYLRSILPPGFDFNRYNVIFDNSIHTINLEPLFREPIDSYIDEEVAYNEFPTEKKYEFYGDTYLIINRDSYSAASSFASTFQCYQMGTIIGEETGGTKIFRANAISEALSRTKLVCRISTTKLYTACYNEEKEGVVPEIQFTPSILDLTHDVDSQLALTKRIIDKITKKKIEELQSKND